MEFSSLIKGVGNTDIYLIDQLLKGNLYRCKSILDAGCGTGRNLTWFLQQDVQIVGVDRDPDNLEFIKAKSDLKGRKVDLIAGNVEDLPSLIPNRLFDFVICNAVLHFANNHDHFYDMFHALWSKLEAGGILFIRTASDIGIENLVQDLGDGRFKLPDESERYLVNHKQLLALVKETGGSLVDPIKTTNVQNLRCMTTFVLKKEIIFN